MKKKTGIKKLSLSRESIQLLNGTRELQGVVGGVPEPTQPPGCFLIKEPTIGPGC
jgi:hypothetical protein